jgi:hypothetical protein
MKNHLCRMLLLAAAIVVVTPRAADAGILSWLSRLSGPGPFWGIDLDVCMKAIDRGEGTKQDTGMRSGIRLSCPDTTLDRRHISWNANFGWALASDNPLDYTGVDVAGKSQRVWLLKLGTSLDYTVHPALDIGIGGGIFHFGGERFESFTRPYLEPARVAVRPLLVGRDSKNIERDGWLLISASWIVHLGTLDGASFGAPQDPFREYNENNWSAGLSVDVIRLFK